MIVIPSHEKAVFRKRKKRFKFIILDDVLVYAITWNSFPRSVILRIVSEKEKKIIATFV